MNREILFRGYNRKNEKWIYGYYFVNRGVHLIAEDEVQTNPLVTYEDFMVEPDTIGQYTGLKDKNRNKIFEGDILRLTIPDGSVRHFTVEWAEENRTLMSLRGFKHDGNPIRISGWCFNWNGFHLYPTVIDGIPDNEEMTIVGNVHDNPELMKGGK